MNLINKLLQTIPFALCQWPRDVVAATVVDAHSFVGHFDQLPLNWMPWFYRASGDTIPDSGR
jgi:hypothetical protein